LDFVYLQDFLLAEAGIVLEPGKEYLCETRLTPVARRLGLDDVGAVVSQLRSRNVTVRSAVVDAMTTNETSFFRDERVWRGLTEVVLPELLERRKRVRRLDIWSGACSSGQEPYSLAMVLSELLGSELGSWRISIVGTDLSSEMVERTRVGRYSEFELGRGLSSDRRSRFLRREGSTWEVQEGLKRLVSVRQMNLLTTPWPIRGPFDLVLLRNVLIYFGADTRAAILERIASVMSAEGYLLLGASEGAFGIPPVFEQRRTRDLVSYRPQGLGGRQVPATASPLAAAPAVAAPIRTSAPMSTTSAGLSSDTVRLLERVQRSAAANARAAAAAEAPDDPLERLRALRREYQNAEHFSR
jgi:chemotaxis protein methyltransferase CheR